MILLHIEHPVPNFDAWKAAFDSDPVGRQKSGVRSYRVSQPVDNPSYAIIDLEFDTQSEAEALLAAMQQVWKRVGGAIMRDPLWRISHIVETRVY
jgi:ribosomal protein L35AE/L33A